MTSSIHNVTVDCTDAYSLAQFWSQVLGIPVSEDDQPGDDEVLIVLPDGTWLLFVQVPEKKTVKNRLHLCLQPKDMRRDQEIERLIGLGAALVDDRRNPDGTGWGVLTDPEGNEFCVLRSAEERAATS